MNIATKPSTPSTTKRISKRGKLSVAYVRDCLKAVQGYKGSIKHLATETGLRRWITELADMEL
jgi:hypothetical protein